MKTIYKYKHSPTIVKLIVVNIIQPAQLADLNKQFNIITYQWKQVPRIFSSSYMYTAFYIIKVAKVTTGLTNYKITYTNNTKYVG